jgi:hypothetical protein
VCGYPVGGGGELYGGSMFIKSAANDTLQGKAIQSINTRWGEDSRNWSGRETIGIPVCKKKYAPFSFKVERDAQGQAKVTVERMFGCHCHSSIRKKLIPEYGCRTGWEPFGQWSIKKAEEKARRQTDRINSQTEKINGAEEGVTTDEGWSSEEEEAKASAMCNNGNCAWKSRQKFDNVKRELTGEESDAEEIYDFYDNIAS